MKNALYFCFAFLFISTTVLSQQRIITIDGENYFYKEKSFYKFYDDSKQEHIYLKGEVLGQYYASSCGYGPFGFQKEDTDYNECANAISIYVDANLDKTIYDTSLRTGKTYHIGQGEEKYVGDFEIKGAGSMGIWTYYYKNGNIKSRGHLINFKKVNRWTEYYTNGKIKRTVYYNKRERREGVCMEFYFNGQLREVSTYKNGILKSMNEFYLKNGKQSVSTGHGMVQYFYSNGGREFTSELLKGSRNGETTWYYTNGKIKEKVIYRYSEESYKGLRWEIIASFDKKGNKREKGTLKDGNGTWINYNEKDEVDYISTYKNGKLVK